MTRPSPLVSASELRHILADVTLLDVRWQLGGPPGRKEFERGHIPGATYVDLETDLADPPDERGRHPLPDAYRFTNAMGSHGVSGERPVVVYDAVAGTSAARCWWLLRYHGHRDVRLLDGGYAAWVQQQGAVETGRPRAAKSDFTSQPGQMPVLDADGAQRVARVGVLFDARASERFRGDIEPVDPVAGHIPGAVNVPTSQNLTRTKSGPPRFQSRERLAEVYGDIATQGPVGVYCGSGVTAAHDVLALELVGVEAALYAGSWSEWVGDPGRPVARGDQCTGPTSARP